MEQRTAIESTVKKTYTLSHEELDGIIKLTIERLRKGENAFSCTALDNAIIKVYYGIFDNVIHREKADEFLSKLRSDYTRYLLKTYSSAEVNTGIDNIDKFKRMHLLKDFHDGLIERNVKYRYKVIEQF